MYKLVSVPLLRELMKRTGTGAPVSGRELATAAGIPHGTIGNLLTYRQQSVPEAAAHAIATRIGVDTLILFAPIGRSVELTAPVPAHEASV